MLRLLLPLLNSRRKVRGGAAAASVWHPACI